MSLLDAFKEFNAGTRTSKRFKDSVKTEKLEDSKEKNLDNQEKAKKIKDDLKEQCSHCNGTGILEETKDSEGRCYPCSQCLGRGFIKRRKKLNLSAKKKHREGNLIGKKCKKRIIKLFLDGLTNQEISVKVNKEEYLIKQIIMDLKDKLEQNLNKNN